MHRPNRKIVIIGSALVIASSGAAYAYWTNNGSGSGEGGTATNQTIVVNQTSTVSGLGPGLPAQPLSGNFDNPNSSPVFVSSVTAAVTGTDKVGCGPTDYTIAGTSVPAPIGQVPPGNGVGSWSGLTIAFNNKPDVNQDACKGAVVTISYTANAS
ncbi:hypothetical protein [Streptomyces sp. NPDC019539]|uniref:hypothetical protein n=1 Tax=Streptomyces sp. NPDC019539 TaxID=3365063 RepID=UPI0037A2EC8C